MIQGVHSKYWAGAILGALVGTPIAAVTPYLALLQGRADTSGESPGEIGYTGYVRQAIAFNGVFDDGSQKWLQSSAAIAFPATDFAFDLQAVAIFDAAIGGNMLYAGNLLVPVHVGAGEAPTVPALAIELGEHYGT